MDLSALLKNVRARLFPKPVRANVYYMDKAPDPRTKWLRRSMLVRGDLWFTKTPVALMSVYDGKKWEKTLAPPIR